MVLCPAVGSLSFDGLSLRKCGNGHESYPAFDPGEPDTVLIQLVSLVLPNFADVTSEAL